MLADTFKLLEGRQSVYQVSRSLPAKSMFPESIEKIRQLIQDVPRDLSHGYNIRIESLQEGG